MWNADTILQAGGLLAVGFTIFAESGLLLGILLPGDTLLLTGGLFAGQGKLSLFWLILVVFVSAVLGYQAGYIIGERAGPKLFKRKTGLLFREEYIKRTKIFLDKYGPATLIAARFIAHVRTLVSAIAGAGRMDKRTYFIFNVVSAAMWSASVTLIGYWLGSSVPHIDRYFFPVIIGGLIFLYAVAIWGVAKSPQRRKRFSEGLKEEWDYFFRHKSED